MICELPSLYDTQVDFLYIQYIRNLLKSLYEEVSQGWLRLGNR